jgi:hypothetical protein
MGVARILCPFFLKLARWLGTIKTNSANYIMQNIKALKTVLGESISKTSHNAVEFFRLLVQRKLKRRVASSTRSFALHIRMLCGVSNGRAHQHN